MQEPQSLSDSKNPDKLLDSANTASEQLKVLHLTFMAVCAYVLVIAFGTTDLDLLIGKGVKLPVIDVEMPIIGFYAVAPFIIVLVHFNLLLQLQLLSRKLFSFDSVVPQNDGVGGLRDRLHIFPYTCYLVGNATPTVHLLAGMMVSITIVLLPLLTLFAIQVRFLAYQDQIVTWWQRFAIWLDLTVIAILWPIILHPKDDWRAYWTELIKTYFSRRRVWLVPLAMLVANTLMLFSTTYLIFVAFTLYLLTPPMAVLLYVWKAFRGPRRRRTIILFVISVLFFSASVNMVIQARGALPLIGSLLLAASIALPQLLFFWNTNAPRGSFILIVTLWFGLLLPLGFMVDGEILESLVVRAQRNSAVRSVFSGFFLNNFRRLSVTEQVLFAKSVTPEILNLIRSGSWREAEKRVQPINLVGRSLRHADFTKSILVGADLRYAQMQGAILEFVQLQSANLDSAELQGSILNYSQLQGAGLHFSKLQGASLRHAQLQGASLDLAQLQGAKLDSAQLQGASLRHAQLQGVSMEAAQLQGANLDSAKLLGANLRGAQLQGTSLQGTQLHCADFSSANLYGIAGKPDGELVILKGVKNEALTNQEVAYQIGELSKIITKHTTGVGDPILKGFNDGFESIDQVSARLYAAQKLGAFLPRMLSCLAEEDSVANCEKKFDSTKPEEQQKFSDEYLAKLVTLACESTGNARGILNRRNSIKGLREKLEERMLSTRPACPGLQELPKDEMALFLK